MAFAWKLRCRWFHRTPWRHGLHVNVEFETLRSSDYGESSLLRFERRKLSRVCQHFGGMYCLHLQPKHGSTTISARYRKTSARPHDIPSEKIMFFTVLFKFLWVVIKKNYTKIKTANHVQKLYNVCQNWSVHWGLQEPCLFFTSFYYVVSFCRLMFP
jgi:hypothetical protein